MAVLCKTDQLSVKKCMMKSQSQIADTDLNAVLCRYIPEFILCTPGVTNKVAVATRTASCFWSYATCDVCRGLEPWSCSDITRFQVSANMRLAATKLHHLRCHAALATSSIHKHGCLLRPASFLTSKSATRVMLQVQLAMLCLPACLSKGLTNAAEFTQTYYLMFVLL